MIIELKKIYKEYVSTMGIVTNCLNNVSIDIQEGDVCAIRGASGSGKTTLLNIIACLDQPTTGEIIINNTAIDKNKMNIEKFRLNNIGIIFQSFNLIDILTVEENIKIPVELSTKSLDNCFYDDIIHELGLQDQIHKFPSELSGGQQQRVAIARALINKPKIILADEPTGNLDTTNAEIVVKLLISIAKKYNMTLLIVTHDDFVASKCSRVVTIKDGEIYE